MSPPLRTILPAALAAAALLAGGCGGDDEPARTTAPAATSDTASTATTSAPRTNTTQTATTKTTTTPRTTTTEESKAPGGTTAPSDCGRAQGGFLTGISGFAVSCATARSTATAWFRAVQAGSDPNGTITAGAYRCRARFAGEAARVRCRNGAAAVTFRASP